ncbi:holin [Streptococcus sp. ZY19097]|uniref:holin n=3 Tax=Streptococcus TaxID=1301 RepID=UPI0034596FDA
MKTYIKKLGIKVVKTMAQAALGVIGSTALISEVNWQVVASTVALSGLVCVLMNLADLKE